MEEIASLYKKAHDSVASGVRGSVRDFGGLMKAKIFPLFVLVAVLSLSAACVTPEFIAAKPVWPTGYETERNTFFGFRSVFKADGGKKVLLRITGSSAYRIFLNGDYVGYGPARTSKGFFRIDEFPLSVKEGTNILAVEAAGYNCISFYHMCQPSFLQAEVVSGGRVLAYSSVDGSFEAHRLERVQRTVRYSFQRTFSEHYRISPRSNDWRKSPAKISALPLAECPLVKYLPRRVPYPDITPSAPMTPVSSAQLRFDAAMKTRKDRFVDREGVNGIRNAFKRNELVSNWWDLLQRFSAVNRKPFPGDSSKLIPVSSGNSVMFKDTCNRTGFVGIRVVCKKPGTIAIKFDELLLNGEVVSSRYGCANVIVWEFEEPGVYETESFEPYTLQYADVMAVSGEFEISPPYFRPYANPDAARATLKSSDPAIVKIFEAARKTYADNAVDLFTDCPGRERAGWLCDSFFIGRVSKLFTGELSMESASLENFLLPEKYDHIPRGVFPMCYPADFPNGEFIPNWTMWLVLQLEEFKKRGGDHKIVEKFRPGVIELVKYFYKFRNSDGLLEKLPSWVFVEWSKANSLTQDVNYPSNMLWAEMLDAASRLYGIPEYAEEAAKVRKEIVRQSWNGEWFCDNARRQKDGTLKLTGECTETCQYYAFYFRTATPSTHPKLWKRLVEDFGPVRKNAEKYKKIWPSNAFIGNYLRLECLSREGLSKQILQETRGFFLYMADLTGTLWEHMQRTASCNHGFASHAAVVYMRDILGVREIDYVEKTVVFSPPSDLPLESISMEIPVGNGQYIRAGWKKSAGETVEELVLPPLWSRKK